MFSWLSTVRRDLNILAGFVNDFLRSAIQRFQKSERRIDQLSAENKNIRKSLEHLNERIERVRAVQASDDAVVRCRIDSLRRDLENRGDVLPPVVPNPDDALSCKMSLVSKGELEDWGKKVEKITKKAKKGRKGKKS